MNTRQGVPEAKAFGPARPAGTLWRITRKDGTEVEARAATAFAACAAVGLMLSEVSGCEAVAG